ncbi:MAG: hypothetical protein K2R98_14455 [Gemmataceae bacterium]|nr:hypothetical protein [Gemmataceae bacterium]
MSTAELWSFLPVGYLFTILIETPILLVGLSARHSYARRLFCGFWLTACTYPIVVLFLTPLFVPEHPILYLAIAETFAPAAECALFWIAFGSKEEWGKASMWRDLITITLANLASFGGGMLMAELGWWDFLEEHWKSLTAI